jgi:hypothetical protein
VPLLVLISFFIGGLSETISALHVVILFLIIVAGYFVETSPRRTFIITLLAALFIGTFAALLAMFFSPANALRINSENAAPSIIEVLLRSLDYTYAFLLGSFKSLPTPFIAFTATFVLLSYLFFVQSEIKTWNVRFAWIFIIIPIVTYGLIFTAFAPSAYGQSYPVERVRFPAHYILNIALIILSVSFGYMLSFIKSSNFAKYAALVLTFFVLLYPFWVMRVPLQTYENRRLWSKRWDERQIMIYNAVSNGETDLIIPGLDGYEGTKELDAFPNYWANKCAANYYGVNSITTFSIKGNVLDFFSE